jgi:mono/diheme cytochrome c family protein
MRKELELIELIEKYLLNELSVEEKAEFEAKLKTDKQLQKLVVIQERVMQGIKHMSIKQQTQNAYDKYKLRKLVKTALIATLIISVIVTSYVLLKDKFNETQNNEPQTSALAHFIAESKEQGDLFPALQPQIFSINTKNDTIVVSDQGIVLFIPKNAFATDDEVVNLVLQEALTPSDILLAGLETMSNGQLLETGGMFNLLAFDSNGKVELAPNKELTMDVPTDEIKPGMMLYDSEKKDGKINWINPKPLEKSLTSVDIRSLDFYPPDYEKGMLKHNLDVNNKAFKDSLYYSFEPDNNNLNIEVEFVEFESESAYQLRLNPFNGKTRADSIWHGSYLFRKNCASCHKILENSVGPPLAESKSRWKRNSSIKNMYEFIKNPEKLIREGDPYALKLFNDWSQSPMTQQNLTDTEIDDIYKYVELISRTSFADSTTSEAVAENSCQGIPPSKIKAIWQEKFNKTNLATKEFEERMPFIHGTCNEKVLEIYVKNLDKPLYYSDSVVAMTYNETVQDAFSKFYLRKDGKVDLQSKSIQALNAYYEKTVKAQREAVLKTRKVFEGKMQKERAKLNQEIGKAQQNQAEANLKAHYNAFEEEFMENLCGTYTELGMKCPKRVPLNRFRFSTGLGPKNIDRLVAEATYKRETSVITDPKTGKSTTLDYFKTETKVLNKERFDRVYAYLIPNETNSFIRMDGDSVLFSKNISEHLNYQTVVIATKGEDIYIAKGKALPNEVTELSLDKSSKNEIDKLIGKQNKLLNTFAENLQKEIEVASKLDQLNTKIKRKEALKQNMVPYVFPCMSKEELIIIDET